MIKFIKNSVRFIGLCLLFTGTTSCVIDSTRPDGQQQIFDKPVVVDIDSDIEDDFQTAVGYLKSEQYDEAIALLEQLIKEEDRVPAPFINLGMAYDKKGDTENAEKNYLKAVELDLTHPVANNQLGMFYRRKGRFDEARKAYSNALTQYPDYLPVVKNLGILCELYIRDLPCALQQYEHYQSLRPDDKTMKIWVTDVSRRIGK